MTKTVVGLFDNFADAQRAVNALVDGGFRRDDISLVASDQNLEYKRYLDEHPGEDVGGGIATGAGIGAVLGGLGGLLVGLGALAIPGIGPVLAAGPLVSALAGAGIGAAAGGLVGALAEMGIPEEHAETYAEGVRRGGTLVTVRTDDDLASKAVDILNRFNPVDVDRRSTQWRDAGWTGMRSTTTPAMTTPGMDYETRKEIHEGDEATLPVIEEDVRIGKREVDKGGVRISTTTEEHPVEETVNLRDERIDVDRRPVDKPLTDADMDAFRDRSVEVRAKGEEAVVQKDARIVEEVHVRKDAEERQETIRDTVRRQDVEVEDMRTAGTTGTMGDYDEYDPLFRSHYESAFTTSGYTYDDYMPAYRYGYDLARNDRYSGRDWTDFEREARMDWERTHPDSAWDDFKDAVRQAWYSVTGRR